MPRRTKRRGGDLTSWLEQAKSSVSAAAEKVKGAVTGAMPQTKTLVNTSSATQLGLAPENKGMNMGGGRKRRKSTNKRRKTKRRS